ncbi:hypothetical protein E2R34_09385 [Rathayibacter toxicus]|nr:hypothetical protein E2R34_09385 [Rathayibacter toxicus]
MSADRSSCECLPAANGPRCGRCAPETTQSHRHRRRRRGGHRSWCA